MFDQVRGYHTLGLSGSTQQARVQLARVCREKGEGREWEQGKVVTELCLRGTRDSPELRVVSFPKIFVVS